MTTYAIPTPLTSIQLAQKPLKNSAFRGVRLTKRGRLISRIALVASMSILIASGYSALSGVSADTSEGGKGGREHLEVIVVAPGESLWSIAKLLGGNQEENVARIIELNALTTPSLSAGTRLIIPTRE
jgi:hypothetical protein